MSLEAEARQHLSQGSRSPAAPVWDPVMPLAGARQNQGREEKVERTVREGKGRRVVAKERKKR